MYLTEGIVGEDAGCFPMAGVFPVTARMQKKRASLGYREVRLEQGLLLRAGRYRAARP